MTDEFLIYVGTYTEPIRFGTGEVLEGKGEGIHVFRMDPNSGTLEPHHVIEEVKNPSFLALNSEKGFLYAVNELKEFEGEETGTVSAFSVLPEEGKFEFLNKRITCGTDPCFVTVDGSGEHVLVANYGTGSVAVFPIGEDGSLGERTEFIQHRGSSVNPDRQEGPHAHSVFPDEDDRYVYVPDLGLDELKVYEFDSDNGKLELCEDKGFKTKPGAGPRHLAFHPEENYVYLINELDSTIVALSRKEDGSLSEIQTVPTLPSDFEGESSCAEIRVSPSGKYVYGSNRGHDSIVIYEVERETGSLDYVGHESARGRNPRHFAISPDGKFLLVANQDSDEIVTFRIDRETGELEHIGEDVDVPTPVCLRITEASRRLEFY